MKWNFLYQITSAFRTPDEGATGLQIPILSVLNWICWTPPPRRKKFLGTPLSPVIIFTRNSWSLSPSQTSVVGHSTCWHDSSSSSFSPHSVGKASLWQQSDPCCKWFSERSKLTNWIPDIQEITLTSHSTFLSAMLDGANPWEFCILDCSPTIFQLRNPGNKGEERETNKMQLIWCLLSNFYLNMFRASLCPSSGEQECALPRMVFYTGCDGCGCVELGRELCALWRLLFEQ